jgi:phosphoribosyl-AMP cyclohydrolase
MCRLGRKQAKFKRNHRILEPADKETGGLFVLRSQKETADMEIDFAKMDGLAPAIVQDDGTGEVLMVGFMNAESWAKTVETGYVTFYSRTRQKLWMKGETSGNRLRIISAATDCDRDTLLFRVLVEGDGLVCHNGTKSCFTELLAVNTAEVKR